MIDVVGILTESLDAKDYWYRMKTRITTEEGTQLSTICRPLKLLSSDGKQYATDCANTEGLFRIIQSIPSPKAEPFKLWLAKVGYERIQEIEDPELAMQRMRSLYLKKWYPQDWIQKRERWIAIRNTLTDEWRNRGIKESKEYAILTDEIYQATFGMSAEEYKTYKWLNRQNLRDHMNDLEVIFTMLGEASTKEIINAENSLWFHQIQKAGAKWGDVARIARKELEKKTGKKIISNENYLSNDNDFLT